MEFKGAVALLRLLSLLLLQMPRAMLDETLRAGLTLAPPLLGVLMPPRGVCPPRCVEPDGGVRAVVPGLGMGVTLFAPY